MTEDTEKSGQSIPSSEGKVYPVRRGAQSRVPLKAAIIGGGKACADLLTLLSDERLTRLKMEILGVADPNPDPRRFSRQEDGVIHDRGFLRTIRPSRLEFTYRVDRLSGGQGADDSEQSPSG